MARVVVNPGYTVRDAARSRDAKEGEIIDVPDKEARLLKALRRASDAPAKAAAEPVPPTPEPVPQMPLRRGGAGRYMRRDERAEDA